MSDAGHLANYDAFAWFYNRYWGGFSRQALPVLERLLLNRLPAGARVLDLCCGSGQLAQLLTGRGLRVTGVDNSAAMLAFARENAPQAEFVLADAREFTPPAAFDAAVSLFDSLNHMMSLEELAKVFRNVRAGLVPGGLFVFDLNTEPGYRQRWNGSFGLAEADHALIARSRYDPEQRLAWMDLTMFRLVEGVWRRTDLALFQREYPEDEVRRALAEAGFGDVNVFDAAQDLQMPGGQGRAFFVATRPAEVTRAL